MAVVQKLQQAPISPATVITPYWVTALWFPILTKMALSPQLLDPQALAELMVPFVIYPWPTNPDCKLTVWLC